jgi:hypothetical protein
MKDCRRCLRFLCISGTLVLCSGCTVKAVGDPNRPITINAHITVDIHGMQNTASNIEDYVSGQKPKESLPGKKPGT